MLRNTEKPGVFSGSFTQFSVKRSTASTGLAQLILATKRTLSQSGKEKDRNVEYIAKEDALILAELDKYYDSMTKEILEPALIISEISWETQGTCRQ